ncbi:hypothetical protein AAEP80_03425 [Curtobacterium sp. L3-7]|uniref:hypothetical protein n=1 Tax=Curtobacterium sp. L3-7 TaxID=3138787 RepID=UPI003B52EA13
MSNMSYEKSPAFFRAAGFEKFFEAESLDSAAVAERIAVDVNLDAELDAILAK